MPQGVCVNLHHHATSFKHPINQIFQQKFRVTATQTRQNRLPTENKNSSKNGGTNR